MRRYQISKAAVRALLVLCVVLCPAILLRHVSPLVTHEAQATIFMALLVCVAVFWEYSSEHANFIEFRAAPPYNRLRLFAVFMVMLAACLTVPGVQDSSTLSYFVASLSSYAQPLVSYTYSPFQFALISYERAYPQFEVSWIVDVLSVSIVLSILFVLFVFAFMRFSFWSMRMNMLNLWDNFPILSGKVQNRSREDIHRLSRINFWLGLIALLWFPKGLEIFQSFLESFEPQTLHSFIWSVTFWMFLFVNFSMRSFALWELSRHVEAEQDIGED